MFIGRPIFWGLSVNGEAGVAHVLDILRDELSVAMGLCGVPDVKYVDRSLVDSGQSRLNFLALTYPRPDAVQQTGRPKPTYR